MRVGEGLTSSGRAPAVEVDDQKDGITVFCLLTGHQRDVVDAAVSLGLARRTGTPGKVLVDGEPSRELTLAQWRAEHGADFSRACSAVVRATGPATLQPRGGILEAAGAVTLPLVPVLLGALLTAAVSQWRDARTQGRAAGKALVSAVTAFADDMRDFMGDGTAGRGSATHVMQQLRAARASVDRQAAKGPYRGVAGLLREQLTTAPLDDTATEGWLNAGGDMGERAERTRGRLAEAEATADVLAMALSTPGRPHPTLWFRRKGGHS